MCFFPRNAKCTPARDLQALAFLFSPFWPLTVAEWRCIPQVGHCRVCKDTVPRGRSSCSCQLLCVIQVGLSPILGPHRPHPLYACAHEWSLPSITPPAEGHLWKEKGRSDLGSGQELSAITGTGSFLCAGILHRGWHFSVWVESHTTHFRYCGEFLWNAKSPR